MLENYMEKMNIRLEDLKAYVCAIDEDYFGSDISRAFNMRQFEALFDDKREYYLTLAIRHLRAVRGFEAMEDELIMMNRLFDGMAPFEEVKAEIKDVILRINQPVSQYRILRHVMHMSNRDLIDTLYKKGYITIDHAAYFAICEGETKAAYGYLSAMDHRPSDALLSLYCDLDLWGALRLQRQFDKNSPDLSFTLNFS